VKCPLCGEKAKVVHTDGSDLYTNRRWECTSCEGRFSTMETIYRIGARQKVGVENLKELLQENRVKRWTTK
jgi:transcriptional regulator NrdR family protein